MAKSFLFGEHRRTLDERFRVSVPAEFADALTDDGTDCILAKERSGALSLWNAANWQGKLDAGIRLLQEKMEAGRLEGRVEEVQRLGRLLSTRHTMVKFAGRGRLLIPEGFREFLGVEPNGELMVVGAALCVELWRPDAWFGYVNDTIPDFRSLFDNLSA